MVSFIKGLVGLGDAEEDPLPAVPTTAASVADAGPADAGPADADPTNADPAETAMTARCAELLGAGCPEAAAVITRMFAVDPSILDNDAEAAAFAGTIALQTMALPTDQRNAFAAAVFEAVHAIPDDGDDDEAAPTVALAATCIGMLAIPVALVCSGADPVDVYDVVTAAAVPTIADITGIRKARPVDESVALLKGFKLAMLADFVHDQVLSVIETDPSGFGETTTTHMHMLDVVLSALCAAQNAN